jgi:hypothetical protein
MGEQGNTEGKPQSKCVIKDCGELPFPQKESFWG